MTARMLFESFLLLLGIATILLTWCFIKMVKLHHSTKEDQEVILLIACVTAAVIISLWITDSGRFGILKELYSKAIEEQPTSELFGLAKNVIGKIRTGLQEALKLHTKISDLLLLSIAYFGYIAFVPLIHPEMTEEVHSEINLVTIFWIIGIGAVLFLL